MSGEIYEGGVDTTELFRLETTGTGVLAIRDAAPRFVLWGNTPLDAYSAAMRALEFASGMPLSENNADCSRPKAGSPVSEAETPNTYSGSPPKEQR